MITRNGVPLFTVMIALGLGLVALYSWLQQEDEPRALDWKADYQGSLWTPLREDELTLAKVDAALGRGQLWMISSEGEPLLVSRYSLDSDGLNWRVQAVIGLDHQRTESLVQAQAWEPGMADQPVAPAVGQALADQAVQRMSMIPAEPVAVGDIIASFGNPDVRMDVSEGQAWVFAREGAVVAVNGEQAYSIMFGLKREL